MLATSDKLYWVRSETRGATKGPTWTPGVSPSLPKTLVGGEAVEIQLRISDDLERWHTLERVESVCLRIRLTGLEPSLNEVRIELNGQLLPDSILQLNDLIYRLIDRGAVGSCGQVYEYHQTPEYYPQLGHNNVAITLMVRDSRIEIPFEVYDVDCAILYRAHRNFKPEPIDY